MRYIQEINPLTCPIRKKRERKHNKKGYPYGYGDGKNYNTMYTNTFENFDKILFINNK